MHQIDSCLQGGCARRGQRYIGRSGKIATKTADDTHGSPCREAQAVLPDRLTQRLRGRCTRCSNSTMHHARDLPSVFRTESGRASTRTDGSLPGNVPLHNSQPRCPCKAGGRPSSRTAKGGRLRGVCSADGVTAGIVSTLAPRCSAGVARAQLAKEYSAAVVLGFWVIQVTVVHSRCGASRP
jgi:hypothetical protein